MGRIRKTFRTTLPDEQVNQIIVDVLTSRNFSPYKYKGEQWYKNGVGLLKGPSLVRGWAADGIVTLEGFGKYALFPGVYLFEIEGAVPGMVAHKAIDKIVEAISTFSNGQVYDVLNIQQPAPQIQQPVPQAQPAPQVQTIPQTPVAPQVQVAQPAVQSNVIYCSKCGTPATTADKFCANCGNTL